MPEELILGEGTMAELVRHFNWGSTSLGPIATWPETLLTQVNVLLACQSPSTLYWGKRFIFFYNDAAIPSFGPEASEMLGKSGWDAFPEAWRVVGPDMDACFQQGVTPIRENVCVQLRRDGRMQDYYFNYSLIPVHDRGRIVGVHGIHENTTKKVAARMKRDAVALQLEQVLDAMSDGVVSINEAWQITYMNARALEIYRCDDRVLGTNVWASFPQQFYPNSPCVEHLEQAMYQRIGSTYEVFYPAPLNVAANIDVRPAREGIVLFVRDITQQKEAEQQLREAESRERNHLQELFENAPAFLALLAGPEHVFEMANAAYTQMMGGRDLIGCRLIDCVPEVDGTAWIAILDSVYRTGVPHAERGAPLKLARTPGGPLEERFVDYVYQPRRRADGTVFGIITLGIDVTEQRRTEKALVQSEKLAAVGRLASSIAHEINNPLAAAMNYLYLAGVSHELREVREFVDIARTELHRVSVISTQTLLSQKQAASPSATSFKEITDGILQLYQGRIKTARVEVATRHRAARPLVCMEGEIRQVFGNLIGNAIDAMNPKGGRLVVRSRAATDWKTGRKGNRMTIADTGSGIPAEAKASIFDPFFTTKGPLGNGLGLWITQEIVARHHGEICLRSVASGPHTGTVFAVFLPERTDAD